MRRFVSLVIAVCIATILISCSKQRSKSEFVSLDANLTLSTDRELALFDRFTEYWDARSRHEFEKSYLYELPYNRYMKNLETYSAELSVTLENYHITMRKLDYIEDRVVIVHRVYTRDDVTLNLKSKWILVNGTWYRKYDFSLFPS